MARGCREGRGDF